MTNTILIVDDNNVTLSLNRSLLEKEGYTVICAANGSEALHGAERKPDCIVLDVMLPDINGFDLAPKLRQVCNAPIIFLTSCKDDSDIVTSLSTGDDYMSKPYNFAELTARVRTHIRRSAASSHAMTFGSLVIHRDSLSAAVDGKALPLTGREFDILLTLAERCGQPVSAAELYRLVWNDDSAAVPHVLTVNISSLKRKLDRATGGLNYIITKRGEGYTFIDPPIPPSVVDEF